MEKITCLVSRRGLAGALAGLCDLLRRKSRAGLAASRRNVQDVETLKDVDDLTAGTAKVRITAFRDGIVRVRVAPNGNFPNDFSWAVMQAPEAPASFDRGRHEGSAHDRGRYSSWRSTRAPLLINFWTAAGVPILEDQPSLPMAWDGENIHVVETHAAGRELFWVG